MQINNLKILLIVSILGLLYITSSCTYHKLLKSDDHEKKLEAAIEYFEKGKYTRSISLFTSILPLYRGTQKAESINYYYAMAHYNQGDYIYAAHLFNAFHQTFPQSEHAEDFFFKSAYCKYLLSPSHSLDQTPTREAIQQFQRFVNRYPNSEKVQDANKFIDELRLKLERKAYEVAYLYYKLGYHTAAATAFKTLIVDFPDIKYREDAMFLTIESYYLFAERSIEDRQKERYQDAVNAYHIFIRAYPDSKFKQEADRMYQRATNRINELALIKASE